MEWGWRLEFRKEMWDLFSMASQGALMVKNPPANVGGVRATGSIPGWGRSPEKETATHSSILVWRTP